MPWEYIFLSFYIIFSIGNCVQIESCNYRFKYSCDESQDKLMTKPDKNSTSCNVDNIPDNAKYSLILENGSSSIGIIKVNSSLPNAECNYRVALLINDRIRNQDECLQYDFKNEFNMELHTSDKIICVSNQNKIEPRQDPGQKCKKDDVVMYFKHIYTGCYALRYTINDYYYVIRSRNYIKTDYQRKEIEEPKFYCTYDDRDNIGESRNLVTFTFAVSILSGSSSMILKLIPLSYEDENKEDACFKYSREPQYAWEIVNGKLKNLDDSTSLSTNCNTMMVHVSNGTYTEDIECNFALRVSYNDSYCFLIAVNDERCLRNTVWNPPPEDHSRVSCSWTPKCTRIIKATRAIEYNGELKESKVITSEATLLIPIAIGVLCIIIFIFGVLIWINRRRMQRNIQQAYLNANANDLKIMNSILEVNGIDDTDDDNEKTTKSLDDRAIVLLYAKGSKSFMEFMAEFREILKLYCDCHIYDWYAACEWDAVARVSACDWAIQLFKKNYRTVWIDTPSARSLIIAQITNNIVLTNEAEQTSLNSISDFRDIAFPGVLDYAKRSIVNTKLQYSKHFIVRLEGHDHAESSEDPFADLSPHARYLIPYHFSQLCSHLSSKRSDNCSHALMAEETKLRERLIQLKNNF